MQPKGKTYPGLGWIHAAAAVLVVCSCGGPQDEPRPASSDAGHVDRGRVEVVAMGLRSDDWHERYEALQQLRAFGTSANDVVLPVLRDPCEVVRKEAQNHFIGLGETTVPYLVQQLVTAERDDGFFGRIAGGKERCEVKSLAGTLWLTLARGTPRDRVFEIVPELIAHDAARIRAVGLFTAAAMRDERFLTLLEPIARDPDPMVRDRYWESLVILLAPRGGSGPDLDEAAAERTLAFLEPELVPLLSSEKIGALDRWQTYGTALARARVPASLQPRFVAMLDRALSDDRLTPAGAARAGAVLAGQIEGDDRAAAFRARAQGIAPEPDGARRRRLAALSGFPSSAFDLDACARLLDLAAALAAGERVEARGLPRLAAGYLSRALAEADREASRKPMVMLSRWVTHADATLALEAAVAQSRVLEEIEARGRRSGDETLAPEQRAVDEELRQELVASAAGQADALFARAGSLPLHELYEVLKLFVLLGDPRYLELFEVMWSHRWDDHPGIANVMARPVMLLSRRQDKAILHHVLEFAESPEGPWHSSVRDLCAYTLSGDKRYGAFVPEFLTEERFERWVRIIDDPDLYPRTRASFLAMVEQEALDPEKRKVLADLALKYSAAPHDSNLRAKAILSLGKAGDRRALVPLFALALETDHPWWIWQNLAFPLAALHRPPADPDVPEDEEAPVPRAVLEALIDLLDAQVTIMRPHAGVRFAYPNNYYWWGIEYLRYPPEQTAWYLEEVTEQEFGVDVARWRSWLTTRER